MPYRTPGREPVELPRRPGRDPMALAPALGMLLLLLSIPRLLLALVIGEDWDPGPITAVVLTGVGLICLR